MPCVSGSTCAVGWGACGAGIALLCCGWKGQIKPKVMKRVASKIVADAPKHLAGAKMDLQEIDITAGSQLLTIEMIGITVYNLEGFASDRMAHISKLRVTVAYLNALKSAIKRLGKPAEVEVLAVKVDGSFLIYEKSLTTSNVKALIDKLAQKECQEGNGSMSLASAFEQAGITSFDPSALMSNAGSKLSDVYQSAQDVSLSDIASAPQQLTRSGAQAVCAGVQAGEKVATSGAQLVKDTAEAGAEVASSGAQLVESGANQVLAAGSNALASPAKKKPKKVPQVLVREIQIHDTQGGLATTLTHEAGLPPMPLQFPPIQFSNFSETVGELTPSGVLAILLSKLLEAAMAQESLFYKVRDSVSSTGKWAFKSCSPNEGVYRCALQ